MSQQGVQYSLWNCCIEDTPAWSLRIIETLIWDCIQQCIPPGLAKSQVKNQGSVGVKVYFSVWEWELKFLFSCGNDLNFLWVFTSCVHHLTVTLLSCVHHLTVTLLSCVHHLTVTLLSCVHHQTYHHLS